MEISERDKFLALWLVQQDYLSKNEQSINIINKIMGTSLHHIVWFCQTCKKIRNEEYRDRNEYIDHICRYCNKSICYECYILSKCKYCYTEDEGNIISCQDCAKDEIHQNMCYCCVYCHSGPYSRSDPNAIAVAREIKSKYYNKINK